jgi:hypothetical protein
MANKPIEIVDNSENVEAVVGNTDLKKLLRDEKFMEETVMVMIHPTASENEPPYAHLNVNGMNQIVPRGQNVPVKRKFVEVLARMKETRYNQTTPNSSEPDKTMMVARHGLAFPFVIVEDKNPKGRAWLEHILAERD